MASVSAEQQPKQPEEEATKGDPKTAPMSVITNGKHASASNCIDVGETNTWHINQFSFPKQYQGFVESVSANFLEYVYRACQQVVSVSS